MTNLFNTKDLLTVATVDQAVIGTKGYFGDNLSSLIEKVRQGKVETLIDVIPDVTYCFRSNSELHYIFFLPADRIENKVKEPVYRPIKTIDELFNFLIPDFDADTYDTYEKAELTLRRMYELKSKRTGNMCYERFSQLCLTKEGDIILDGCDLKHFFENYEIKKDGKFVPFGILEE